MRFGLGGGEQESEGEPVLGQQRGEVPKVKAWGGERDDDGCRMQVPTVLWTDALKCLPIVQELGVPEGVESRGRVDVRFGGIKVSHAECGFQEDAWRKSGVTFGVVVEAILSNVKRVATKKKGLIAARVWIVLRKKALCTIQGITGPVLVEISGHNNVWLVHEKELEEELLKVRIVDTAAQHPKRLSFDAMKRAQPLLA